jgi:hypothetical protein
LKSAEIQNNEKATLHYNRSISYYNLYDEDKDHNKLESSIEDAKLSIVWNPFYSKPYFRLASI